MYLEKAVRNINRSLNQKQPPAFNHQWVKIRCKVSYRFITQNVMTELGDPDWDLVVSRLEQTNQKRWMKGLMGRIAAPAYKDRGELSVILEKYNDKLYTFLGQADGEDRRICDWISIRLVRMAQKGNLLARKKALVLTEHLVDQWTDNNIHFFCWRGHRGLIHEQIEACIRRYRYTGSFIGYLHKTLEYVGRGLRQRESLCLDQPSPHTGKRMVDNIARDYDTGEVKIYNRAYY